MNSITSPASVAAVTPPSPVRPVVAPTQAPPLAAAAAPKQVVPIRYYGGIEGMNATNLIVALQANGVASGSYDASLDEHNTPAPVLVDREA